MLPARAGSPPTRVAVVQMAYHPAVVVGRRSPLEDPLFDPKREDSLAPSGEVPAPLDARLDALRRRIREAYDAQVLGKVGAVLERCRAWGVRIVVFPEYSIPWEILGGVADAAGEMVVVAGTHTVDQAAKKSGVYERLVTPARVQVGQAVCPVLHRGRLLALQPKLNASVAERDMRAGDAWAPVTMPEGLAGPMGVLVCLDFLFRDGDQHRALVAEALAGCRFLAVPSLTPAYTLPELAGKAWEEARRYGRPVLYADGSEGGGTSVYVDEGQAYDLRRFPDRAGYLEAGDEGVIVADVDLGFDRAGRSTRYGEGRAVVPVAEATFVYRSHAVGLGYAQWLEETGALCERDDDEALEALAARVERDRDLLLNAGALSGAKARGRRLGRLVREIGKVTSVEEVRQFTREVVMPGELLPLGDLRGAMAGAAADVVFGWLKEREARAAGFAEVEERLRKAVDAGTGSRSWTSEGTTALAAVGQAVRGPPEREEEARAVDEAVRVVLPAGIDPAALGVQRHGGWVLVFRARPEDFRALAAEERPGHDKDLPRLSEPMIRAARDLMDLALARAVDRVAAVVAFAEGRAAEAVLFVALFRGDCWLMWTTEAVERLLPHADALAVAFRGSGLGEALPVPITPRDLSVSIASLLPRFDGGREVAERLLAERLAEVGGSFVEPDAAAGDSERTPVLGALDAWLGGSEQTALVLGEFGSGKSTVLAAWACRVWERVGESPRPLLVSLAGASASASAEVLLLGAAQLDDTPANRAALRLLVRRSWLVPCFDGFDEMATRLDATDLAGRLSELLGVVVGGGKVVVSSRDDYFPTETHLRSSAETALGRALGASAGLTRMVIQPFTDAQVRVLVGKVRQEGAEAALDHIARIYDLRDLVRRPLLLGMVLQTLERLDPAAKVGRADLYEAYLGRWLDQTRSGDPECFTDEQKKEFAEALAEQLWRSGATSCTWQELQLSVHVRLRQHLPENMPLGAAFLEIQGGTFFVHEGEDRYRFAHKSFLEYFFARALVATLPERPTDALRTKPITPEVAAFVGEILRRDGIDPRESWPVRAVQMWLTGTLKAEAGPAIAVAPVEATAVAAANALRLLLELSRWTGDEKGWIPEGADLRMVNLAREDLSGASLVRADLSGADLVGANMSFVDLTEATLEEARVGGVELTGGVLVRARAQKADFTQAKADKADLRGADLSFAVLRQSTWTACCWDGVKMEGADTTGWAAPGSSGAVTTPIVPHPSRARVPWDGEEHFMPSARPEPPPPSPTLDPAPAPAFSALPAPVPPPLFLPAPEPSTPIENPFRPGRALIEAIALPGREPVIAELLALIGSRSAAVLRGPRRAGKTSILFHLKARLVASRLVRHVTLEGRSEPIRTADDLAVLLDPTLRDAPEPAATLSQKLRKEDNTVLLLDEIANLEAADASVFAWLRAVGQETTSVVLAGSHWDWVRIVERAACYPGSSFGNDVTPVNLGPLDRADALRFLADTAPPDVPIAEGATALWIVERCGPWPFYLQVMGYAVVQDVRAGRRRALVEPEGVSDLYEQRLLLDRDAAAFGTRWAELPARAQRILRELRAGGDLPRYRDLSPDDRRALRDTGLCNALGHWLIDPPFRDWIRRIGDVDAGG